MRDFALLFVLFPMLYSSLRYVHIGAMFWIWTALAGPTTFLYGFLAELPLNKMAVVVTLVAAMIDRTKRKLCVDAVFVFHTLLVLQGLVSFSVALTESPRFYDLMDRVVKVWLLTLFLRIANRERMQIHYIIIILGLTTGGHAALEGLKFVASLGGYKVTPPAIVGDNNYLAMYALMMVPFLIYLRKYSVMPIARLGFAGMAIGTFVGFIAANSRGGLVGLLALGFAAFVRSRRKAVAGLFGIIGVIGLIVFAPTNWTERMETIKTVESDSSFMSRISSWKMNTLVALDRPFLGGGYSAMEDPRVFRDYLPQFGMLDFIPSDVPSVVFAAHSIYFAVLGDLGFIGLFLFLAMLAAAFYNVKRVRMLCSGKPELAWAADLATAFQMALVVYLVSGAALSASYSEVVYVLLTVLSMLRRSLQEDETAALQAAKNTVVPGAQGALAPAGRNMVLR